VDSLLVSDPKLVEFRWFSTNFCDGIAFRFRNLMCISWNNIWLLPWWCIVGN